MTREQHVLGEATAVIVSSEQEPVDWVDELLREGYEQAQAPPPVRLADLLDELAFILRHYLYFPNPATTMLLPCWMAMTYCFQEFKYAGYLAIRSKGPSSGKTRLLELLSACCDGNPSIFTNPTPAVLIRGMQKVVLIDEVDRLRGQDKETHARLRVETAHQAVDDPKHDADDDVEEHKEPVLFAPGAATDDTYHLNK